MSVRAIVSGYATVDYVMTTTAASGDLIGTRPATVVEGAWPRAGGAPLYASRRFAAAGLVAAPLVSVGDDANSLEYRAQCERAGVSTQALMIQAAARMPVCLLVYHPDGQYSCLFDPGALADAQLAPMHRSLLDGAELIVAAAGPATLTGALLSCLREDQSLAWIAKRDTRCFPPDLRAALARRADFVFCNQSEREFVETADAGASGHRRRRWLVETRGGEGAWIEYEGGGRLLPVAPVQVRDATGAGDTLAGEVLARMLGGERDPVLALESGIAAAAALLRARSSA